LTLRSTISAQQQFFDRSRENFKETVSKLQAENSSLQKERSELKVRIISLALDMTNIQKHETSQENVLKENQVLRREL
jgi:regulator of replication initiation timing